MAGSAVGLGLDIGTSSVKLVELRKERDGIHVVRAVRVPLGLPPEGGAGAAEARVGEILTDLLGDPKSRRGDLAVATQGSNTFTRYAKLPPVASGKMDQIVTYEAQQTLPFSLDELIWAYQRLSSADPTEANIVLVAVKVDIVEDLISRLKPLGLTPSIIDNEPLAVYNALKASGDIEEGKTTVLLHIGSKSSDLSIERDGRLCWTTSIRVGAARMVDAVAEKLSVDREEAKALLASEGSAPPVMPSPEHQLDDRAAAIAEAVSGVLDDLVFEVQRSIGYFRSQLRGKTVHKILISGGAANLGDLAGYLSARLGSVVAVARPFEGLIADGDVTPEDAVDPTYSVAVGLAMRGIGPCEININLIPQSIRAAKEMRKKIPYVGACCALAAASILLFGQISREKVSLYNTELQSIDNKLRIYRRNESALKQAQRDYSGVAGKIEKVEELVADRDLWPDVLLEVARLCEDHIWIESFRTEEAGAEGPGRGRDLLRSRPSLGDGVGGAPMGSGAIGAPPPGGGMAPMPGAMGAPGAPGGSLAYTSPMGARAAAGVEAGDALIVTGYAQRTDYITEFLQRLSSSPLFESADLGGYPTALWKMGEDMLENPPDRTLVGPGGRAVEAPPVQKIYRFQLNLTVADSSSGGSEGAL